MPIKFHCGEDSYCGLNLTLCSMEAGYQCFIWTYCLYLQGMSWILQLYVPLQHCFTGPLDYILCKTQNETIIWSSLSRMYVESFYCHHGSGRTLFHMTTCNTLRQDFAWWQEMLCLLLFQLAKNLQSVHFSSMCWC